MTMRPADAGLQERLLESEEPSIRYRVLTELRGPGGGRHGHQPGGAGKGRGSQHGDADRESIRTSSRVATLLSRRDSEGRLLPVNNVYQKWTGAHWVLVDLADMGYPPGDAALKPLRDQVYDTWLAPHYYKRIEGADRSGSYRRHGVRVVNGRARRCASQQGNALYATVRLGIADERAGEIVRLLLSWQWPDGGWNCDNNPEADTSSFHETISPMRGLASYATWPHADPQLAGNAAAAAGRAAEVFLVRRLFRRRTNGNVINNAFLRPAYPRYWHYDILGGLVVLAEMGLIGDPRCAEALDKLESTELPGGGWAAPTRHWRPAPTDPTRPASGVSQVKWGPTGSRTMNEWVTVDALSVLRAAGRR